MIRKKVIFALSATAFLLMLAPSARAQSVIAGVVKDSSGAVLPGVTVEAASDALIEKVRTVTSDGEGLYKVVDLRPGIYTVTFTLTGFQTYKREGLELPSNFTMTINADMKVGALEESVTVSGSSPVVDVQSNAKAMVLPRDVLDSVPNAHTIQSVGQLIPGITLTAPDVGGSQAMQQTYFTVHGSGAAGTSVLMDGMIINGLQGDGSVQSYLNDAGSQEVVYQTGGGAGDSPTGGLKINLVPREGGNRFAGSLFVGVENWQSDNFTDFLKANQVTSVDKIGTYHDFDVTQGGPIKKDKLWFFGSGRAFTVNKPIASTVRSDGTLAGINQCRPVIQGGGGASCPQGVDDQTINSALARLTWQVSPRNKLSFYHDRIHKDRAGAMNPGDDQTTAAIHWNSPIYMTGTAKWTSTVSNRLLVEGGYSTNIERYNNLYQDGIEHAFGTTLWYSTATRQDTGYGTRYVAGAPETGQFPDRYNAQASASYVTGSHNLKFGFQDSWGKFRHTYHANGDLAEIFISGKPSTVTLYATDPFGEERLKANLGIYAQDSWTLKHLTVNGGLRYEYVKQQVDGMPTAYGTFAVIQAFNDIPVGPFKNWSPRVAVVYDLTGDGKTAIRAGYNKFTNSSTTNFAGDIDPANGANVTAAGIAWTDSNSDGIADYKVGHDANGNLVGCVYLTPGCEINFAQVRSNFGSVPLTQYASGFQRPYANAYNLGVQRELMHGVSATFEWFHSDLKNNFANFNFARPGTLNADGTVTNATYRAVTVFSPIDGSPITMYDAVSTAANQLSNIVRATDPNLKTAYNGFDVNFNVRLPGGARVFGGSTTERTLFNTCAAAAYNPNNLVTINGANNCDQANSGVPWKTQIKISGTYPVPFWGLQFSGAYQGLPGYTVANVNCPPAGGAAFGPNGASINGCSTWTVTASSRYTVCPGTSAAQGCVVGALVVPSQIATLQVPLDAPSTKLTPRNNQVDIAVAKKLKFGRLRVDPKVDLFNLLNTDDYFTVRTMTFVPTAAAGVSGGTYNLPASVLQGRLLRIGANVTW
jgi:hypothetical protein